MIMLVLYFLLVIVVWHQDRKIQDQKTDIDINEPMLFNDDDKQEPLKDDSSDSSGEEKIRKKESSREKSYKVNTPIEVLFEEE